MYRLVALGALLAALVAPTALPVATAAPVAPVAPTNAKAGTGLGVSSWSLDVVMTNDGAAHVAYLTRTAPGQPYFVHVCRIPAGGATCAETTNRVIGLKDTSGPWIVSDGTKVVVAVEDHDGADASTYAAVSADGTGAYSSLMEVADLRAADVELAPGGSRLWVTAADGPSQAAADYQAFATAPLPGGVVTSGTTWGHSGGSETVGGHVIGVSPEGKPVAFVSGSSPAFAQGSYYRSFNGIVNDTEPNDQSKWGGLTKYDLGAPYERNGGYDVASGYGRMWLAYEGLQKDTVLRPFVNGAFAGPVTPDCVASRFPSGTQDAPDLAIAPSGDLLVTETGSNGSTMWLGFLRGSADGSRFSPYTELASAAGIRDVEVAADPASSGGGVAVWTSDAIYGGPLSFARFPAVAPATCPPPEGFGSTTAKIGGVTVELKLPDGCVPTAKKYVLKVKKKKGKGTVTRVDFKATGAKKKADRRAPFKVKFKVKKGTPSGAVIKVKVKVTVKKPNGQLVRKKMKSAFTVC
jgi:hypothetical protein